jgi:glycosyltransferase involved in cell wall biosynthesis
MGDLVCDLVIPAFNERDNIDALFDAIESVRPHLTPVVIRHCVIGDNNSTDGTGEAAAARNAVVVRETRRGYGSACLRALAWIKEQDAPPDVVVFLDADLADDPAALPELLQPLRDDGAEIVIGSRVKRAEPGALNVVQRFGNGLACTLMRILGGVRYGDLGPFRAVRWSTLQRLHMSDPTWGWTVEMQMKAALLSMRIVEVDVPYRRRRAGKSKISGTVRGVVMAGTKIISTILGLWWHRGRFRRADAVNTMS